MGVDEFKGELIISELDGNEYDASRVVFSGGKICSHLSLVSLTAWFCSTIFLQINHWIRARNPLNRKQLNLGNCSKTTRTRLISKTNEKMVSYLVIIIIIHYCSKRFGHARKMCFIVEKCKKNLN